MKKYSLLPFVVILLLINACKHYTGEFRDVKNEYIEISLPDWLEETTDLAKDNPNAFFQFKSRYRNTYGLVIKEEKGNNTFNQYQQKGVGVLRGFGELTNLLVTDSTFTNNTYHLELMGDMDSEKIYYWHNTYESNNNYYQLVLWTRSYDRKQKYTEPIEKIIKSFKILD